VLPINHLVSLSYGNGLALSMTYDQDYQPSTRTVTGGMTVQSVGQGYHEKIRTEAIRENPLGSQSDPS
jgi:hypothetical protein